MGFNERMEELIKRHKENETDPKEFGNFMRELRKQKGLTLEQLGGKLELSNPYLSQIENGKKGIPSMAFIFKFANAMDVDPFVITERAGYFGNDAMFQVAEHIEGTTSGTEEAKKYNPIENYDVEVVFHNRTLLEYKGDFLTTDEKLEILDYIEYLYQKKKQNKSK